MDLPPFDRLLDEHGPAVHRFLVASVGPGAADDCFQDAVVAALRAYPQLTDDRNLRSWFFTVAHSRAVDGFRRRARSAHPVAEVADRAVPPEPDGDDELWAAVRALPTAQRDAVVLRYVGDLAYRDVAAALGCTEAAARQRVRAGLTNLREVLA